MNPSGRDRPPEKEAVRTTIVGGRPPGSGRGNVKIPRGIEILVKKASVDDKFRRKLLAHRAAAADEIGLKLDPTEAAMLQVAPEAQLTAVIDGTVVPDEQRRIFLGQAAALMLAALSVGVAGCAACNSRGISAEMQVTDGIRPDRPENDSEAPTAAGGTKPTYTPVAEGVRPDRPSTNQPPAAACTTTNTTPVTNEVPYHPVSRGSRPDIPRPQPPTNAPPDAPKK